MLEGALAKYQPQKPQVFVRKPVSVDDVMTILREFKTLTAYQTVKEADLRPKNASTIEPSIFDDYYETKSVPTKKAFWEYLVYKAA